MARNITVYKDVMPYDDVTSLRKSHQETEYLVQEGGQEKLMTSNADIVIYGGMRGGGKSFGLLFEPLYDIYNKNLRAIIFRNSIDDLSDIVDTSYILYNCFGTFNRSRNDLTWNLNKGGFIKFNYFSDSTDDFKTRFRGRQYAYIGIDEITQMEFEKFKFLATCNRNAFGIRNRIIGTCNPDPDSWVAQFIDWWLTEDGLPDDEKDGVVRYCFMDGSTTSEIIWGNTRDEVYEQARDIIDSLYTEEYRKYGRPQDLFIKSVSFIIGKLADNKMLLESDPAYLANLANQSQEQRERDLCGNWKYKASGDDLIKIPHMEAFFNNAQQVGDGVLRASCDVAFTGGDNLVMWLLKGWHIVDCVSAKNIDSQTCVRFIREQITKWGVQEENFTYDLSGIGQAIRGFFPKAMPFNNLEAPYDCIKGTYDRLKSQCAFTFAEMLIAGELSIDRQLLDRKFNGVPLRQILMKERKVIRPDGERRDYGKCLIKKQAMKRIIGHSPDFIEALLMVIIFKIKVKKKRIFRGIGLL